MEDFQICGIHEGGFFGKLLAWRWRPFMPSVQGSEHKLGSSFAKESPLQRNRFRHGQNEMVTFGGGDKRSAIAVCRWSDSMITVSFFKVPRFSASSIMDITMRSLTLPSGLNKLALENWRGATVGYPIQTDQRRVADGFTDVL